MIALQEVQFFRSCTSRSAPFRGISHPTLPYLPPVPRASTRGTALPALRYACTGLLRYHPSEVNCSSVIY